MGEATGGTGGRGCAHRGGGGGGARRARCASRARRNASRAHRNASRAHFVGGALRNAIHHRASSFVIHRLQFRQAIQRRADGATDGATGGGEIRVAAGRDAASGAQAQPSEAGIPLKVNPRS